MTLPEVWKGIGKARQAERLHALVLRNQLLTAKLAAPLYSNHKKAKTIKIIKYRKWKEKKSCISLVCLNKRLPHERTSIKIIIELWRSDIKSWADT